MDDSVTATTMRDLAADGSVSFAAHADGSSTATAKASAAGADTSNENTDVMPMPSPSTIDMSNVATYRTPHPYTTSDTNPASFPNRRRSGANPHMPGFRRPQV